VNPVGNYQGLQEERMRKIMQIILVLSLCVNFYLLSSLWSMKRRVDFVNQEANAQVARGDLKGSYQLALTITNTFGLSREDLWKALKKASDKFYRSKGTNEEYQDALFKQEWIWSQLKENER
jgi:hypothetical protein